MAANDNSALCGAIHHPSWAAISSALTMGSLPHLAIGPDYYLIQTGNEFLELWHAEQAAWLQAEMFVNAALGKGESIDAAELAMGPAAPSATARALHQRLEILAGRIENMQAQSVVGLCVKAIVVAWFHRDTPPDLACYGNALDLRLTQSILMDLIRLVSEQPAGERMAQIQRLAEASQAAADAREFMGRFS